MAHPPSTHNPSATTLANAEQNPVIDELTASDAPPPYEVRFSGSVLRTSSTINPDGTLNVNFASSAPAEIEKLLPPIPDISDVIPPPQPTARCPPLNIVVQVVGSRGDVQPFVALGVALQKYGHRVRLATHNNFDKFVRSAGLEFYGIGGDPEDLMAYMVRNPGLLPSLDSLKGGDVGRKRTMMKEMLGGFWRSCFMPDENSSAPFMADAIIANPPSFAHCHLGQRLNLPVHIMFTMPWTATRAFPHPLANIKADGVGGSAANYLSYGIVETMTWQGLGGVINRWRIKELDLEPVPALIGPDLPGYLNTPYTYCWSSSMVPKPKDWGPNIDICGFFMREEPAYTPPEDLANFLASGPTPVYIGFGSIVLEDAKKMTENILEACRAANVRAIISRGWSKLGGDDPSTDSIFYLGDCPHEWLFKRVSAVVHHGGAGTTACGLFNSRPTLIVPFFGDQPFWGAVVAGKNAGPRPIPHKELNSKNLADAIAYLLTSQAQEAARGIADQMRQEDGVKTAVDSFHRHVGVTNLTCDVLPDLPAAWVYSAQKKKWNSGKPGPETKIRLSNVALKLLIRQGNLELSDVKSFEARSYHLQQKQYDPVSAGAFSTFGLLYDYTNALGGTFIDPFKQYRNTRKEGESSGAATLAATGAVGKGMGSMGAVVTKGALVDVPVALADGFKSVQQLYDPDDRDYGKVKDWKSGGKVAGKNFGINMYEAMTDIVTKPYKGAKEEGAAGFAKGFGKGTLNMVTKTGSATFGLIGYSSQGIYKSIRDAQSKAAKTKIEEAKRSTFEHADISVTNISATQVVARFEELVKIKGKR